MKSNLGRIVVLIFLLLLLGNFVQYTRVAGKLGHIESQLKSLTTRTGDLEGQVNVLNELTANQTRMLRGIARQQTGK